MKADSMLEWGARALLGYQPPEYAKQALINASRKNLTMCPGSASDLTEVSTSDSGQRAL